MTDKKTDWEDIAARLNSFHDVASQMSEVLHGERSEAHPIIDPNYKLGQHNFRIRGHNIAALAHHMEEVYRADVERLQKLAETDKNAGALRPWRGLGKNGNAARLFYPLGFKPVFGCGSGWNDIVGFKTLKNRSPNPFVIFAICQSFVESGSWYTIRYPNRKVRVTFVNGSMDIQPFVSLKIPSNTNRAVDVVVSKHPAIVEVYRRRGYRVAEEILVNMESAPNDPKQWDIFDGAYVLTTEPMPLELAARCGMLASIPLALPAEYPRRLSISALEEAAGPVYVHKVARQMAPMYAGNIGHNEHLLRNRPVSFFAESLTTVTRRFSGILTEAEFHEWFSPWAPYPFEAEHIPSVARRYRAYLDGMSNEARAEKLNEFRKRFTNSFLELILADVPTPEQRLKRSASGMRDAIKDLLASLNEQEKAVLQKRGLLSSDDGLNSETQETTGANVTEIAGTAFGAIGLGLFNALAAIDKAEGTKTIGSDPVADTDQPSGDPAQK